jgi:hypothetical protein
MSNNFWEEVFKLVEEYDSQRPKLLKENRLYYNTDGSIIGLWETGHPIGDNYIVMDDPGIFFHSNTHLLRVQNKKLVVLDPNDPNRARLKKSTQGFKTIKGHAALVLNDNEVYQDIEYYDRADS